MPLRLIPIREIDVSIACLHLIEAQEWGIRTDIFAPPLAILGKPDSLWLSAVNGEELVGIAGFHGISWIDGVAEMFTSVVAKWRHSGAFGTVTKHQLEFGFKDLGFRKITMTCLAGSPSAKLADKMQVPIEGRFAKVRRKHGEFYDGLQYGLMGANYV
jgi:RimJ/RimL family protein N-acetyltransferase